MDTKSDCASHHQSLLRDQLASEVRSAEHGQRFTEERTPLAVDLNVGVNLVVGQDKHGEVYVPDCAIVPALSTMPGRPEATRSLRSGPLQVRQPHGSFPGPYPRIRAAEAHSFPSYDPESRLPVAGCHASRSPLGLLAKQRGLCSVADRSSLRLPVAADRLPLRLPVAGGCRP